MSSSGKGGDLVKGVRRRFDRFMGGDCASGLDKAHGNLLQYDWLRSADEGKVCEVFGTSRFRCSIRRGTW